MYVQVLQMQNVCKHYSTLFSQKTVGEYKYSRAQSKLPNFSLLSLDAV